MIDDREKGEPEWTAIQLNRTKGDTTLESCGWCIHTGGGSYRYNCMLSGRCSLMKDYGELGDVKWDTPCRLRKLGKADVAAIIRSKEYNIKENERSIKDTKEEIKILKLLKFPDIPASPDARSAEHFNTKDRVYVFMDKDTRWPDKSERWAIGTVVPGYRHHDGCVSYVLDDYPESKKGWGCGVSVPRVLLKSEFDYFRKHPTVFKDWLDMADRKYNGDKLPLDKYFSALKKV